MAAFLKFYIKESLEYEMTVYKICITCMKKNWKRRFTWRNMKMLDDSFLETSVVHIVHFWRNCNIIRYSIYSFKKLYNAIFNVMILKLCYHPQRQNNEQHCQFSHVKFQTVFIRMLVPLKLIYRAYLLK